MSRLRGERLYRAALQRLKSGETEVVDTTAPDFRFSTTTVAVEAGKKKGYVRSERYPELCKEIAEQESIRKKKLFDAPRHSKRTPGARVKKISEQYELLKREHEACLERMLNLLLTNYALQSENRHLKSLTKSAAQLDQEQ